MKSNMNNKSQTRIREFPELQVGFPECNDASPIVEMERVHVDFETMDISRKNAREVTLAIAEQGASNNMR